MRFFSPFAGIVPTKDMMKSNSSLYANPSLYGLVFPSDQETADFYSKIIDGTKGPVIDLGCGNGELSFQLSRRSRRFTAGVDLSLELLRGRPADFPCIQGDIMSLPFQCSSAGVLVSCLFAPSYAVASKPEKAADRLEVLASEIRRVLKGDGRVAAELPLAYRPRRLQGIEERATLSETVHYRFEYLDVILKTKFGAVLSSHIEVTTDDGVWEVDDPLHVFTPEGARRWFEKMGLSDVHFCASYDLSTRTRTPPDDCLRAVAIAQP